MTPRVVTVSDDWTVRVWDAGCGVELARLRVIDEGQSIERVSAVFSPDAALVLVASGKETVQLWDATWMARLQEDALVRAAARRMDLVGEGRLTDEELRVLRPILGEVDADIVFRWLATSPHPKQEAQIEAALVQWRRHREMAIAPARNWAARAAAINADPAELRSGLAGSSSTEERRKMLASPLAILLGSGEPRPRAEIRGSTPCKAISHVLGAIMGFGAGATSRRPTSNAGANHQEWLRATIEQAGQEDRQQQAAA